MSVAAIVLTALLTILNAAAAPAVHAQPAQKPILIGVLAPGSPPLVHSEAFFKTGGRLIRHARHFTLQLAESYLTGALFQQILQRIEWLGWHPT